MNRTFAIFLWFALGAGVRAQQLEQISPPKEPILPRMPTRAEWIITYHFDRDKTQAEVLQPEKAGKKPEPKEPAGYVPKETQVSKDGTTYREVTTWADGHQTEKWIVDGLEAQSTSQGGVAKIMLPTTFYSSDFSDYSRSDFEVLEWVAKANYKAPRKISGATVYEFGVAGSKKALTPREQAAKALGDGGALPQAGQNYVAFLDVEQQRPVYLDDGEVIRIYSYPAIPSDKLSPPEKFAEFFANWKKKNRLRTAVPLP